MYVAKAKLDSFTVFLDTYVAALSSNSFHLEVYCREDNWQLNANQDADGDRECFATSTAEHRFQHDLATATGKLQLTNRMGRSFLFQTEDPCGEDIEDEDGQPGRLAAFTTVSRSRQKVFVTVCSDAWNDWNDQLPARSAGGLRRLRAEELDDILNNSPEPPFLHELTHVESLFGKQGIMN